LTDTVEEPSTLRSVDHAASLPAVLFGGAPFLGFRVSVGETSALSRLQSSLLTSMPFMTSSLLASGSLASAAWSVSSGLSSGQGLMTNGPAAGACAAAGNRDAMPMPTTRTGSLIQPNCIAIPIPRACPRIPGSQ